jgi:plastocyanin
MKTSTVILNAILLLGIGVSEAATTAKTSDAKASDVVIEIKTFAFSPQEITVAPGTTVTWVNEDQTAHNVVSGDGKFASSGLDTDDRFTFKFEHDGDFTYVCALHPHMIGKVHVHAH